MAFISLQSLSVSPCLHSSTLRPEGLSSHASALWFTFTPHNELLMIDYGAAFCSVQCVLSYSLILCAHILSLSTCATVQQCFFTLVKFLLLNYYLRESRAVDKKDVLKFNRK